MAYYSAKSPHVFHTGQNCSVGTAIERHDLREGRTEKATICPRCAVLQARGTCIAGTPHRPH